MTGLGVFTLTSIVQKSVLITATDQLGEAVPSRGRSVQKSRSRGERYVDYNMSPIEYFLGSCLVVEDVHNPQIEIPRRLGCEKPCGGTSVVRERLHVKYTPLELPQTTPMEP